MYKNDQDNIYKFASMNVQYEFFIQELKDLIPPFMCIFIEPSKVEHWVSLWELLFIIICIPKIITIDSFNIFQVRLQTMPKPAPGETPLYKGTWDCLSKTVSKEVLIFIVVYEK